MMNLEQLEATEKKVAAILAESGATLPEPWKSIYHNLSKGQVVAKV